MYVILNIGLGAPSRRLDRMSPGTRRDIVFKQLDVMFNRAYTAQVRAGPAEDCVVAWGVHPTAYGITGLALSTWSLAEHANQDCLAVWVPPPTRLAVGFMCGSYPKEYGDFDVNKFIFPRF